MKCKFFTEEKTISIIYALWKKIDVVTWIHVIKKTSLKFVNSRNQAYWLYLQDQYDVAVLEYFRFLCISSSTRNFQVLDWKHGRKVLPTHIKWWIDHWTTPKRHLTVLKRFCNNKKMICIPISFHDNKFIAGVLLTNIICSPA